MGSDSVCFGAKQGGLSAVPTMHEGLQNISKSHNQSGHSDGIFTVFPMHGGWKSVKLVTITVPKR